MQFGFSFWFIKEEGKESKKRKNRKKQVTSKKTTAKKNTKNMFFKRGLFLFSENEFPAEKIKCVAPVSKNRMFCMRVRLLFGYGSNFTSLKFI